MKIVTSRSVKLNPWLTIWTQPRKIIRNINEHYSHKVLFLLAALGGISTYLDFAALSNLGDKANASAGGIIIVGLALGPVLGIILWILSSAIYSQVGKLFGGNASFRDMQIAIAWANVPLIISLLLWIPDLSIMGDGAFSEYVSPVNPFGVFLIGITSLLEIVFGIWYFFIIIKVVAEAHQFSTWKGLLVTIIPGILILVFLLVVIYVTF